MILTRAAPKLSAESRFYAEGPIPAGALLQRETTGFPPVYEFATMAKSREAPHAEKRLEVRPLSRSRVRARLSGGRRARRPGHARRARQHRRSLSRRARAARAVARPEHPQGASCGGARRRPPQRARAARQAPRRAASALDVGDDVPRHLALSGPDQRRSKSSRGMFLGPRLREDDRLHCRPSGAGVTAPFSAGWR